MNVGKLALAAWFGQWLGSTCAVVNMPLRQPVVDYLEEQSAMFPEGTRQRYWADWALYGIDCPTCRGVWVTLILGKLSGASLLDVVAANALHAFVLDAYGDGCDEDEPEPITFDNEAGLSSPGGWIPAT